MAGQFDPNQPHNNLALLPPTQDVETKGVLKHAIAARAAIEGLKHAGRTIPNQSVLLRSIVLQDAKASSEIENIVTTNDELYRALSRNNTTDDPQTREVMRYSEAMWRGFQLVRDGKPLNSAAYCALAAILTEHKIAVRFGSGTRVGNSRTGAVIYTPPVGKELIQGLLDNLVEFQYAKDDLDPLVKIAIGHYQFEAIHPFADGNGRTGRLLNILWMAEKQLLELPVLYMSQAINESKSEYYARLRAVTEHGKWEAWVSYFLELVETTAIETRRRIEAIRLAIENAKTRVRSSLPKIYTSELVDLVFSQPYTRIAHLEAAGIAKRQTASVYLQELERIGILRSQKVWREVLYINDDLMKMIS